MEYILQLINGTWYQIKRTVNWIKNYICIYIALERQRLRKTAVQITQLGWGKDTRLVERQQAQSTSAYIEMSLDVLITSLLHSELEFSRIKFRTLNIYHGWHNRQGLSGSSRLAYGNYAVNWNITQAEVQYEFKA